MNEKTINFKKLPIGIQTFRDIRDPKENMVYIDKTADAYRMATRGRYYFLARPRRFGKSLFLDTLSELFKGSKHLFEGLYIYDKWDWTEQFPVIKISLAGGEFWTEEKTNTELREILFRNCENLGIDTAKCEHENLSIFFGRIISQAYSKYQKKVVILIDEYDKPILDNIHLEDKKISTEIRNLLRSFYGIIKNNDEYIRLVFITGVSKFSKLNLFSGLNNLEDITIDPNYATITGYSHQDLVDNFSEYLEKI